MKNTFLVDENKLRLDRFLAQKVSEFSRSRIQKDIEAGRVFVNGEKVDQGKHIVRLNDSIEYDQEEDKGIQAEEMDLNIVYEDDSLLVVDKPAGLVVHPASGYKGPTLVQGLIHRYPEIHVVGEDEMRPGIVHRLDKDTSGVMLVAKTQGMFEHLKDAFSGRKIRKEYIALLCGQLPNKHGFLNDPIGRHPTDFRKMATVRPTDPKEAITEYTVLEYLDAPPPIKQVDGYTLVRVKLHTGRTHQIRVHFSSLGFPIAGDTLYGNKPHISAVESLGLKRQFLHAQKIEVQMPDSSWIEAQADLPEALKKILIKLNSQIKV